ncbi:hypothetical protein B0H94_11311 [Salsuginibacillus halophilus]|uniref:RNA-binding protein KhpB N-terminal domain-containing protein n=1 Tax=Salsuginibacillus halophilus TaxID=517424 RepID=A0A2P8H916_9BACI|nr:FapA family protein [Salsuginibacillus halophilus]PSL42725.1 hypothetical protein B0H94_11311 [Salsuginibacillus halophilus]
MTEKKRFTGRTVTHCIRKAEEHFQQTVEMLDVKVLTPETDKSRFFLRRRPMIEASLKSKAPEETTDDAFAKIVEAAEVHKFEREQTKEDAEQAYGQAWVHNGQLHVQDGSSGPPVVYPGEGVTLHVNDKTFRSSTPIREKDNVVIELANERVETSWSLHIHKNDDQAILQVNPGSFTVYTLEDRPPDARLTLETQKKVQMNNELQMADVLNKLESYRVVSGILYENIQLGCETDEPVRLVVAEGKPAVPGKDGDIDFTIDIDQRRISPKAQADGSVDFRETNYIPNVDEGNTLASIHPPEEGEEGLNIYGETIEAPDGYPLIVKAGRGVSYSENEQRVIAEECGRPKVERHGQIVRVSVLPQLVHNGDLNTKTGNLSFIGDIDIRGAVEANMRVEAGGEIHAQSYVEKSTLRAAGSITVQRNAISSTLIAGAEKLYAGEAAAALQPVKDQVAGLLQALKQLYTSAAFQQSNYATMSVSQVLRLLISQKFPTMQSDVKHLVEKLDLQRSELDTEWHDVRYFLQQQFLLLSTAPVQTIEELETWYERMKYLSMKNETTLFDPNIQLNLGYATKSTITSAGHVHIFGGGCTHSNVSAAGDILVSKTVIGGTLKAEGDITAKTVGSAGGARTYLSVPADRKISIQHAYADTTLHIGDQKRTLAFDLSNALFYLNEDGIFSASERGAPVKL